MTYELKTIHRAERVRNEGMTDGETLHLIRQISLKVLKEKSISAIASELEETEDSIRPIYDLVIRMPGAIPEEILMKLRENKTMKA